MTVVFILTMRASWKTRVASPNTSAAIPQTAGITANRRSTA